MIDNIHTCSIDVDLYSDMFHVGTLGYFSCPMLIIQ